MSWPLRSPCASGDCSPRTPIGAAPMDSAPKIGTEKQRETKESRAKLGAGLQSKGIRPPVRVDASPPFGQVIHMPGPKTEGASDDGLLAMGSAQNRHADKYRQTRAFTKQLRTARRRALHRACPGYTRHGTCPHAAASLDDAMPTRIDGLEDAA